MKKESHHCVSSSSRYNNWKYKYLFLFFLSSIRLFTNCCFELPSGIEDTIIKVMKVTTAEYDLLFSISVLPSTFLCLIGGVLVDRLVGLRIGLLIVVSSALLGQIVWAIGGFTDRYFIMLVGRFFIGAGNQLVIVISHAFKAVWFKEDLPFALSIDMGFGRIGGTLAILLPQFIYDSFSVFNSSTFRLGVTLLTFAGLIIVGLSFAFIIFCMDYMREQSLEKLPPKQKDGIKSSIVNGIKQFSFLFWLTRPINATYYSVVFSFVSIAQDFFINKYSLSIHMANLANSMFFGSSVIFTPIFGFLITKTGFHLMWLLLSIGGATLPALLIFTFSNGERYMPFIAGALYSLSYTIGGPSLMAIPALLIDKEYITTAYGIQKFVTDTSFLVVVYASGYIIDTLGYYVLQGVYTQITLLGLDFILLLIILDAISDKPKLNVPSFSFKHKKEKDSGLKEED